MDQVYKCRNCKHIYDGIVSSCDCNNEPFKYTTYLAIPKPTLRNPKLIDQSLISPGVWVRKGTTIFAVTPQKKFIVGTSSSECDDPAQEAEAAIANARVMGASKLMLETLMVLQSHFRTRIAVNPAADAPRSMLELINNAIQYATVDSEQE